MDRNLLNIAITEEKPYGFNNSPLTPENVLFIGDPHINVDLEYYDYDAIYENVFKLAKEKGKEYIVILGDIYDNINKIGVKDLKTFSTILQKGLLEYKLKFILLTGNHDISGIKTKKNIYELYSWNLLQNTKVVLPREIFKFNNFYFLPNFQHQEELEKALKLLKEYIDTNHDLNNEIVYIVSHNDFKELFDKSIRKIAPGKYFREYFPNKNIILISGHIHKTSLNITERIYCAGNFLDTNFKDSNYNLSFIGLKKDGSPEKYVSMANVIHISREIYKKEDINKLVVQLSLLSKFVKKLNLNIIKNEDSPLDEIIMYFYSLFTDEVLEKLYVHSIRINIKENIKGFEYNGSLENESTANLDLIKQLYDSFFLKNSYDDLLNSELKLSEYKSIHIENFFMFVNEILHSMNEKERAKILSYITDIVNDESLETKFIEVFENDI